MGNAPFQETPLLRRAAQQLREILPRNWEVGVASPSDQVGDRGHDVDFIIRTPGGETVFVAEAKSSKQGARSAQDTVERLRKVAQDRPWLVVTEFANPALRKALEGAGVSYLDETGWVYLRSDDTGLFVVHEGAKRSPSAEKREATMTRLDGPGASAVIRSLWQIQTPSGVRELAVAADVSPGTVAKVLPTLANYGAIERSPRGMVTAVDRRLLLERWVQDYGFLTTNSKPQWFLASRGPDVAFSQLMDRYGFSNDAEVPMALTGYTAARAVLPEGVYPVIPHTLLSIYASDPELIASSLGWKPATRQTANVVIVRPRDTSLLRNYPVPVSVPQTLADLTTMGGRFPELAEQVLGVLESSDL